MIVEAALAFIGFFMKQKISFLFVMMFVLLTACTQGRDDHNTAVISQITHRKWQWLQTQMSDDKLVAPRQVEAFTLVLREDGVVMGTSDCNRFSGAYRSTGNKLSFGNMAATRMYCENSQEADFLKQLGAVDSYFIDGEGRLVLQLKFDSGSMLFR